MTYKVVAVIWTDPRVINRSAIPSDPESLIFPTITFGIIVKRTRKFIILVSDLERYDDRDDATYSILLRANIDAIKEYGEIEIENLRIAP